MLWRLARPTRLMFLAAFIANLAAALFEGGTIGALVLALKTFSGPPVVSLPAVLGRLGPLLGGSQATLGREPLFLGLVCVAVLAQVLRSGLQFLGVVATATVQVRVQSQAYSQVFARIMRLSFPAVSRYRLGDLTDYLSQAKCLNEVFVHLNVVVGQVLLVMIYVVLLLWISWPMTLVALALFWVVSRGLRAIIANVRRYAAGVTEWATTFTQQTTELLQAVRLVHIFAKQEQVIKTVDGLTREWIGVRRRTTVWGATVPLIMDTATVLGIAAFLIGGYVVSGSSSGALLPHLLAFLLALHRMAPRLGTVHSSLAMLASFAPSVARLGDILEMEEGEEAAALTKTGRSFTGLRDAIECRHVTLRYHANEPPAVVDLSLKMPRGSFTALVGASGAGKSSVADLLLCLYRPTSGTLLVDGMDLRRLNLTSWLERLGVVSQEPFLFHASVRENIAFGKPDATPEEIMAAARAAHADEFIVRLGQGYDTVVGDRGYRLSGGQRQRIALARALVRQPDILILDEATSALDSESEHLIQQAMDEQRGRRTVFAIAHRLSTVAHADQILVLAEGRLVEQGTHQELLMRQGLYARLWQLQSGNQELRREAVSLGKRS